MPRIIKKSALVMQSFLVLASALAAVNSVIAMAAQEHAVNRSAPSAVIFARAEKSSTVPSSTLRNSASNNVRASKASGRQSTDPSGWQGPPPWPSLNHD
jgi:anti-sigma factor ChrR (cupin superfamily)